MWSSLARRSVEAIGLSTNANDTGNDKEQRGDSKMKSQEDEYECEMKMEDDMVESGEDDSAGLKSAKDPPPIPPRPFKHTDSTSGGSQVVSDAEDKKKQNEEWVNVSNDAGHHYWINRRTGETKLVDVKPTRSVQRRDENDRQQIDAYNATQRPGSLHDDDDDLFYECNPKADGTADNDVVEEDYKIIISVDVEPRPMPIFSAIASPRGIRRKLKRFFLEHSPKDVFRTDELVTLVESGEFTEQELFAALNSSYGTDVPADFAKTSRSTVMFEEQVLELRTDTSGMSLGSRYSPLSQAVEGTPKPNVNVDHFFPRRKGKRRRRMKRMSLTQKECLYSWREDLRPVRKFAQTTKDQLVRATGNSDVVKPIPKSPSQIPVWPPRERERDYEEKRRILSQQQTRNVHHHNVLPEKMGTSSTSPWVKINPRTNAIQENQSAETIPSLPTPSPENRNGLTIIETESKGDDFDENDKILREIATPIIDEDLELVLELEDRFMQHSLNSPCDESQIIEKENDLDKEVASYTCQERSSPVHATRE